MVGEEQALSYHLPTAEKGIIACVKEMMK